jgi:hypothetical protein
MTTFISITLISHTVYSFLFLAYKYSWISWRVLNHEIKNLINVVVTIYLCTDYSRGSITLCIHVNAIVLNLENLNKLRVSSEVYWKWRPKSLTLFIPFL